MRRREMLAALGGATASLTTPLYAGNTRTSAGRWPFEETSQLGDWTAINAAGLPAGVPGCVYDGARLESGVPLGGLGTGYLRLDGNGRIGVCSIFNDLVPPRKVSADWLMVQAGTRKVPLSAARIAYWGHFPVADLHADFPELPIKLGLRAFSPFIVGDAAASNIPAALFELDFRNDSDEKLALTLELKFPEPPAGASLSVRGEGVVARDEAKGVYSVPVEVAPRQSRRVRFALGWYTPSWRDSGHEPHVNRYTQRFRTAADAADFALKNHDRLLARVLAWQAVVYQSDQPAWLRDALIQGLYSLAKNSVWIARTRKDEWWGEDGWFTHSESHTGCPIVETMVCRIHGHFALLFFFPELEHTTLDAFRHFQVADGEIPFCFGQNTSMRDPRYHCQHPLNSGDYAQMVYQLYIRTGDAKLLTRFYDSAKRAIRYQYSLDDDGSGLVHEQPHARPGEDWPANQFYDTWPWEGVSSYVAGTWLATLAAGIALAQAAGDSQFAAECSERLGKARRTFTDRLWTGSYYRLWNNVEANRVSEVCLANQMMGQWCAKAAGIEDVFPAEHVTKALDCIERFNMRATSYGLINATDERGKPFHSGYNGTADFAHHIFFGENLCAAMAFLYYGREETGLEIGRRLYEAVARKNPSPWNQRCLLTGDAGLPLWGDDYYSNLVIWAVPMALRRQSVKQFANAGLVTDMIRAAAV